MSEGMTDYAFVIVKPERTSNDGTKLNKKPGCLDDDLKKDYV